MAKINLLAETIAAIKSAGKTTADVVFIGSRDTAFSCTWEQFEKAGNFVYENLAFGQSVAVDLVIVFADGASLTRGDIAGLEKWVVELIPTRDAKPRPITRLYGGLNRTVSELNK